MKQVAWGYVTRDLGNGKELLVAIRSKHHRCEELVLPGGRVEEGEHYVDAAIREVKEETGIDTFYRADLWFRPNPQKCLIGMDLAAHVDDLGQVNLTYLDGSGKEYIGRIVPLLPVDPRQTPSEQASDAINPAYMLLDTAFSTQETFTPACQVLLKIIKELGV